MSTPDKDIIYGGATTLLPRHHSMTIESYFSGLCYTFCPLPHITNYQLCYLFYIKPSSINEKKSYVCAGLLQYTTSSISIIIITISTIIIITYLFNGSQGPRRDDLMHTQLMIIKGIYSTQGTPLLTDCTTSKTCAVHYCNHLTQLLFSESNSLYIELKHSAPTPSPPRSHHMEDSSLYQNKGWNWQRYHIQRQASKLKHSSVTSRLNHLK